MTDRLSLLLTFRKQREKKGAFLLQGAQASLSAERRFGAKMWLKLRIGCWQAQFSRSRAQQARMPALPAKSLFCLMVCQK